MAQIFNIACLQTRPMPDIKAAIDEALPLAEKAVHDGAEFLFLPEYCGGLVSDGPALVPPTEPEERHAFLHTFRNFAKSNGVWVMIGSIAVNGPDGKIRNRGFILDDQGNVQSRYDKIHMFDIQLSDTEIFRESANVAPGNEIACVSTPLGMIGHTICYDLRFPHLYRSLAQVGAEILAIPAAFMQETGKAHWHVLNRARAIENGTFVIAPCAIGEIPGGGISYGHSLVVNPWGEVIADGGERPGIVSATIDLEQVASARARIPSLNHDRPFGQSEKQVSRVS